jgi:hypothetical protein
MRQPEHTLANANAISTAGSALNTIGLLTYAFAVTRSSVPVGVAVLVGFLPVTVCAPLLSHWLSGVTLRRTGVATAFGQAAAAGAMAAITFWHGPLALLYACAGLLGLLAMTLRLTILTSLPELVAKERLTSANIRLQVSSQVGAMVGAGLLAALGKAPAWTLFIADGVTFVIQAAVLAAVLPAQASGRTEHGRSRAQPLSAREYLPYLVLLPAGFITLNTVNTAMPLLSFETLNAGQRGLALAEVVYPVAAIAAGLLMRRARRLSVPLGVPLLAVGWLLLAGTFHMAEFLVGVAVLGTAVVVTNAATQAWVQGAIPRGTLLTVQSRAAACGAAVSTVAVLGVSSAFSVGQGRMAIGAVGVAFVCLAIGARWLMRAHSPQAAAEPEM